MTTILEELSALRDRAWTTAGARYNAARRLRTRSRLSLATISLISAVGVAIPILTTYAPLQSKAASLGIFSALLSLFILVVALIESASGHDLKADALHRNAEALNAFRLRLNVVLVNSAAHTHAVLEQLTDEYEHLKETCPINHEVVDFKLLKAEHPVDFKMASSWWRLVFTKFEFFFYSTWWLLMISISVVWAVWKFIV